MKKLFLSLAVIASVSLFSCGGNKAANEEATEGEATEAVAEAAAEEATCETPDSCCADSAAVVEEVVETPAQ